MRTRLLLQIGVFLAVGGLLPPAGYAQSQRDMVCQGSCGGGCGPCPASGGGTAAPSAPATVNPALGNAVQSLGFSLGQQLGKAVFGDPAARAASQAASEAAAQQRALEAQQLNNSGIYLFKHQNYSGAINEFQQALAIAPNDAIIRQNLASAKQGLKDHALAARNSSELSQFLGGSPATAGNSNFNFSPQSFMAGSNASALNLVDLDSTVVDLRGATSTSPALLRSQLDGIFAPTASASAPPDKETVQEIDKQIDDLYNKAELDNQQAKEFEKQSNEQEFQQEVQQNQKQLQETQKQQQQVQDELKNVQPANSGSQPHN